VSTTFGSAALSNGFAYVAPGGLMLRDMFTGTTADGWTMSPLGGAARTGRWSMGPMPTTETATASPTAVRRGWSDYTVSAKFRLSSLNNYPGGIRVGINPATGAGYVVDVPGHA
jgi:hypothetical protein